MPPARLEKLVLVRLQGLHPPWVQDDDWKFFMRFVLEVERQKSWSVVLPHADPRHPGYNGTNKRVAPDPVIVECSGLGGGDLNLAQPWHVCVKTNKHKQQVYGPSLALVEESVRLSDHSTVHYTGLGLTKSLQEFLVLHYYATDSAASWYSLLQEWFPQVRWTSPGQLRYLVRQIYRMVHIAPSHRRTPHPCWTGPMNLLLSLILGHGRKRIVSLLGPPPQVVNVLVRGFSAGSFVGLTVLHLLWKWQAIHARGVLGAIACPPALLERVPHELMQQLVLLHYRADQLCMWRPAEGHALARRTVYVSGDWKLLNHFGSQEHSYCHWLDNVPPLGTHPAWKVMLYNPDMANPQKRDASALRLLSWLSFSLDEHTSALLAKLMKQLATEEEGSSHPTLPDLPDPALFRQACSFSRSGLTADCCPIRESVIKTKYDI